MKKTFPLAHPKIKAARLADAARCEVHRYLKRSRNRPLPEGADFWDFDCKFGPSPEEARPIDASEIAKAMCAAEAQHPPAFHVEILAKPGHRAKAPPAPPPTPDAP